MGEERMERGKGGVDGGKREGDGRNWRIKREMTLRGTAKGEYSGVAHLIRSGGPWGFQWLAGRPRGSCQGPSPCDLQEAEGHHCLTQRLHRKRALAQERNTIPGFYKVTARLGDSSVKILQQFNLLIAHHCQYLQWATTVWSRNLSSMSLKVKQQLNLFYSFRMIWLICGKNDQSIKEFR